MPQSLAEALRILEAGADQADQSPDWPSASWSALNNARLLAASIPKKFGGAGLAPVELLMQSEAIARSCLTTAFIFSQREAAVRRVRSGPDGLKEQYLPGLGSDELLLTIGISQLTTSQRHRGKTLQAQPVGETEFSLNGYIPWVTAADEADAIVVGAPLPDGSQMLALLPTDREGVSIQPPMPLAALNGSRTSEVNCNDVTITTDDLLTRPAPPAGPGGGGLETSCLALGLTTAALDFMAREASTKPELVESEASLRSACNSARQTMHELAVDIAADADRILALRVECTQLALASSQAALVAAKGTGFVVPHPAQRFARQALFFLVWSCPRPVTEGVLAGIRLTP